MFDRVVSGHRALLRFAEQHRFVAVLVLLGVLVLFVHSLTLAGKAGFSFATDPDAGEILVNSFYGEPESYDENSYADQAVLR